MNFGIFSFSEWQLCLIYIYRLSQNWYSSKLLSLIFLCSNIYDLFLFFFYTLQHDHSFLSIHFSWPTPLPSLSPTFLQKIADLPVILTEYCKSNENKTRKKSWYQGWSKQPSRRKSVLRADERVRETFTTNFRSPTRKPSWLSSHIRRGHSTDPWRLWVFMSLSEPYLVDSVGNILWYSQTLWHLQSFLPIFHRVSSSA